MPLPEAPPMPSSDVTVADLYDSLRRLRHWAATTLEDQTLIPEQLVRPDGAPLEPTESLRVCLRPALAEELPDVDLLRASAVLQLQAIYKRLREIRKSWDRVVRNYHGKNANDFGYWTVFLVDRSVSLLKAAFMTPSEVRAQAQASQRESRKFGEQLMNAFRRIPGFEEDGQQHDE